MSSTTLFPAVHPRVGGEHANNSLSPAKDFGSSPRGRGTCDMEKVTYVLKRFIPAWAGNMKRYTTGTLSTTVHPRVGGEHDNLTLTTINMAGSSPRGRGTCWSRSMMPRPRRFIPAWAGNICPWHPPGPDRPVHPRVGGEHLVHPVPNWMLDGSSPRGRGTLTRSTTVLVSLRFIPAWAGNMPSRPRPIPLTPVHPRVGGEHVLALIKLAARAGSSPRGRGTLDHLGAPVAIARFIPAWAGNIIHPPALIHPPAVHPRVGGEHR